MWHYSVFKLRVYPNPPLRDPPPIASMGEDTIFTLKFAKDNWSAYIPPEYSEPDLVTSLLRIYPPVSKLFNTYICDNFISHKLTILDINKTAY